MENPRRRPGTGERENNDARREAFLSAAERGRSTAGVVPGGANAGGFAASNLRGFRGTLEADGEEGSTPVADVDRWWGVAEAADKAWERARRVRWERRASLSAKTNALPQRLWSFIMNSPTTKRRKYRLNLLRMESVVGKKGSSGLRLVDLSALQSRCCSRHVEGFDQNATCDRLHRVAKGS